MYTPEDILAEAAHLGVVMVDQIEYVDLHQADDGGAFRRNCTEHVRELASRDALKRVIEAHAARLAGQPLALRHMTHDSVCLGLELLVHAIKAWVRVISPSNAWVKDRRLVVKLETVEREWIEDERPAGVGDLVPASQN